MGMTMTEKILARGAGDDSVRPADLVLAKVDSAMGHDLTIPPAGKIMREQVGAEKIWDPDRVAVTQDHFQPAKDAASATLGRLTREFSHDMGIKWYFEVGQGASATRSCRRTAFSCPAGLSWAPTRTSATSGPPTTSPPASAWPAPPV